MITRMSRTKINKHFCAVAKLEKDIFNTAVTDRIVAKKEKNKQK